MIKARIASTAALFTFGIAALGGTVVAIAAPANADTAKPATTATSDDKMDPKKHELKFDPAQHDVFPQTPNSPHAGQGHKGLDEYNASDSHQRSQRVTAGVLVPTSINW